jgi:hypothetical protein
MRQSGCKGTNFFLISQTFALFFGFDGMDIPFFFIPLHLQTKSFNINGEQIRI